MNRLAQESSPYLLQHAENPVDWYPWGAEALERAQREDRPILLSIGYSSCHWCHVMERESFEDPVTAELMNGAFINIKVDREERPDIDQIYMKAVQAMTGSGGWPLTVFLTPMQEPYYGGTYFPPEPRHGLPSFQQVLKAAGNAYRERPGDVQQGAEKIMEVLRATGGDPAADAGEPGEGVLDNAASVMARQYDPVHGGFGRAPKFPQPVTLELLLRRHVRTGDPQALEMCVHTLRRMADGGLRDHLGGGFHRYSVDSRWLVPHFEKMLYDNALLARVYTDAYRVTGAHDLSAVAQDTLDYMLRDLRGPEGGFYSARDADSEGEEGTFYLWTPQQVSEVLPDDTAHLFNRAYGVTPLGNFEGSNILHLPHPLSAVAAAEGMEEAQLARILGEARQALEGHRRSREHPFLDDKVLVSWNGMALRALAEAGRVLKRPDYLDEAQRTADFLWNHLRDDHRLFHTWKDGTAKIDGFLEDYGALGNALLSVYEVTLDTRWISAVAWCCDAVLERFWDEEKGRFYDTSADGEALVVRPRDPMDNATPSGTSLTLELLVRAGHLLGETSYDGIIRRALAGEAAVLERYPPAFGRLLSVVDRRVTPPTEVVVVGAPDSDATQGLLDAAWASYGGNRTVAGGAPGALPDLPLLAERSARDGVPTAYVCRSYACEAPVTTPEAVEESLTREGGPGR